MLTGSLAIPSDAVDIEAAQRYARTTYSRRGAPTAGEFYLSRVNTVSGVQEHFKLLEGADARAVV